MATNAHTEVPGGKKAPFPPFQGETVASQLFWLAICFAALYVLLSRILLPRIGGAIAERNTIIESDLAAANRLKNESEAAQVAYEKSLAEARAKAQALASESQAKAAAEAEAQRKKLEEGLKTKLEAAEKQIASTKTAAMSNVRGIAIDTTGLIVERLTGKAPAQQSVERAVDAALH